MSSKSVPRRGSRPSLLAAASMLVAPLPVAAFAQQPAAQDSAQSDVRRPSIHKKVALVVGIDHYAAATKGPTPVTLSGAVNDARHAAGLLVQRFGFAPEDVLLITDEKATHTRVVQAFHDWLIAQSGPQTEAVFWWAGHGSRVRDVSGHVGAEEEGKDSTLVCYDSRASTNGRCFDLTDDELYSLVRALCRREARVTVVTDSCHSGGVTRGLPTRAPDELPPRFSEESGEPLEFERDLAPFWPKDVDFIDDGDPRRLAPIHYVHLAACAPSEVANELLVPQEDGKRVAHGALSFFLEDALAALQPGTTYEQLVRDVAVRLGNRFRLQQVQGEGELQRGVLSADFAPPLPGFRAVLASHGRNVDVSAGQLQLLRAGSILEITSLDRTVLGRAVVKRIQPASCVAEWVGSAPALTNLEERTAVQATEVERPAGGTSITICVEAGAALDPVAALLARNPSPPVNVTRDPKEGASYRLRALGDGRLAFSTDPDGFVLWKQEKPADPAASGDDELARSLLPAIAQEARWRGLMNLALTPGGIPIQVRLEAASEKLLQAKKDGRRFAAAEISRESTSGLAGPVPGAYRVVDRSESGVEDVATVSMTVDPAKWRTPVYVHVLCVSEDRSVTMLWPEASARDNQLTPGASRSFDIQVFSSEPPGGGRPLKDRILVIATELQADFGPFLRGKSLMAATDDPQWTRGGDESRLPALLEEAFAPHTRGVTGVRNLLADKQGFGLSAIDMTVVRPPPAGAAKN